MSVLPELQPKQKELFRSEATEILYGGAAGGGKSHGLRMIAWLYAYAIPGLQVYLFRRISEDLIKNHVEGPTGFRAFLQPWVDEGFCSIVEGEIRLKNQSRIFLCHCHEEKDRFKYQGSEIHLLLIDELTHFSDVIYRFLRSRVRMTGLTLPAEIAGRFPRIMCGSNPGNIGHGWVKRMFIDGHVPHETYRTDDSEGGMLRQFIPAKLEDNQALLKSDPTYRQRLRGMGSEALVKAMEHGDWNVLEGAYFDCWDTAKHVIAPFEIPSHWTRFRSFDWGSLSPFSVGWWAVASEEYWLIPKNALICYREWAGATKERRGLKLTAFQVAEGILARQDKDERITYSVADPSVFRSDGGPSNGEMMSRAGVWFKPADNERVAGWSQVRGRLIGIDGVPLIYWFNTCVSSISTLPALMHDEHKPEDVDSDGDDHDGDQIRYACMSRPWGNRMPKVVSTDIQTRLPTLGEIFESKPEWKLKRI